MPLSIAEQRAAVDALASTVTASRAARVAEAARRVDDLADLAKRWLSGSAAQVRSELAARVAAVERLGAPPSLFTLMGQSKREKPYNRILAWILDPAGNHGMGAAPLRAVATCLGATALVEDLDRGAAVEVRGEVTWPPEADSANQPDLVVLSPSFVLLIENKVLSPESGPDQYAEYLAALVRLATTRDADWAAWLSAPDDRSGTLPAPDDAGHAWNGAVRHAQLAELLRAAADGPTASAWGRVACLLVAAQLDAPEGPHQSALDEARRLLSRNETDLAAIAEMRAVLPRLHAAPPPWPSEKP